MLLGVNLGAGELSPEHFLNSLASSDANRNPTLGTSPVERPVVAPGGNELPLPGLKVFSPSGADLNAVAAPAKTRGQVLRPAGRDTTQAPVTTLLGTRDPGPAPRTEIPAVTKLPNVEPVLDVSPRDHPSAGPKTSSPLVNLTAVNSFTALAPTNVSAPSGLVMHELPISAGAPEFRAAFANQIVWLVKDGVQSASLRLNPPQLGAVNVHITLNQSEALVNFAVQSEAARDAIEQALPQLKTLLEQSGLKLGDAQVSTGHPQSGEPGGDQTHRTGGQGSADELTPQTKDSEAGARRLSLIDQYV